MNLQEYMRLTIKAAKKSQDPETQVGALLVAPSGTVLAESCNKLPTGVVREYDRVRNPLKRNYIIHAELSVILKAPRNVPDCSLFTTLYPCEHCAAAIVEAGIKKVYYKDDKPNTVTAAMFLEAGVQAVKLGTSG